MIMSLSLLFACLSQIGIASVSANDAYDDLRIKWAEALTGGTGYNTSDPDIAKKVAMAAQTSWGSLNKTAGRTYLWSDLNNAADATVTTYNFARVKEMAVAYKTYGSSLYGNTTLKTDIIDALDWLYTNRYNETTGPETWYTWYDQEIATPLQLTDTVILMYDDLIATPGKITNYMNAISHFSPDPTMISMHDAGTVNEATGANRIWKSQIVAVQGVIMKSSAKLTAAKDALNQVMDYVVKDDGFYKDGSFVQHLIFSYNGGYGANLIQDIANVLYLLNGSSWQSTYAGLSNVYNWVYDAYEPFIYDGSMMDMVRGREIARSETQGKVIANKVMGGILRLAQIAPPADAQRMKSMVKYWLQQDSASSFYRDANLSVLQLAKAVMNDTNIVPRGQLSLAKVYAGMDRAISLKPGFGFGVSMSSKRIANYETGINQNYKGWYTGEGMTYLYNNDSLQYVDYWPTVNKYRLPGTTVDTMARADNSGAAYLSPNTWTGGTELLNQYTATGMDLKAYGSTLKAKKSWFTFDDEIVALGSGINSTDGRTIETTIENRSLNKASIAHGIDTNSAAATPAGSEPMRLMVNQVTDSGNDGFNLPENTLDNNLNTRWTSLGDGQWIQYDLGKVQTVAYVGINFLSQTARATSFDIQVSSNNSVWTTVYSGSSTVGGTAADIQVFNFTDVNARYVKIVGHGNTSNQYNHITEVQIYGPNALNSVIPISVAPLKALSTTNNLETIDNDIFTRWSSVGDGQSLKYDLGSNVTVGYAGIGFFIGNVRKYSFDIQTSTDDATWTTVFSGQSVLTSEIHAYDLTDSTARYVKIIFHGNDLDLGNRLSEIQFYAPNALGTVLNPLHTATKYNGDEQLIVNGVTKPAGLGWIEQMSAVSTVYMEGTGGYYFPQPAAIKGLRESRQGNWAQLSVLGGTANVTKKYLTLWYDHGTNPVDKDYAYVMLPNKTAQQTTAYSNNPDISIVVNNASVQMVKENGLGITGANFWTPDIADGIIAYNPSSIMLKDQAGVMDIAVSDPTHLQDKITYEITKTGGTVTQKDSTITILQLSPTIKFEVNTQAKDGASHKLSIQYDTSAPIPPTSAISVVDDVYDYSKIFSHTANLVFSSSNAARMGGDTSKLVRTKNLQENVIYKAFGSMNMDAFDVDTWFAYNEPIVDFEFYASPDNINYTLVAPTRTVVLGTGTNYHKVSYSNTVPAGTKYLKIVYMNNTANAWNPALARAVITSKL
ncbi:polysaccharide lyase family 8 super-sandwich domain-containing protein [Cohnella hashimotonis]|uniref:Polysaccharide lyase family 8 super-sandwich domain-containing protein n=1 Tax=Cohnella hashimotonis TaxID=2826895 RepID=A0ABT6TST4_9BACL|nr:polysaccharide lyase family 8 super-sandwich domain-containing protein [Cohnella hashimotonis]MDI4649784.1 polysaccharide lyase family 8 super-sandwich domain-containing protein [Cohnella hashimotonis]